jgi:hypothetical protein
MRVNPQTAHRLCTAIAHHGDSLITYLQDFADSGYVRTAMYLRADGTHIAIGLDGYDRLPLKLNRVEAAELALIMRVGGVYALYNKLLPVAARQALIRNTPTAVVSRSFDHRPSQLHKSRKTMNGRKATERGRIRDEQRAAAFRATCSTPYMQAVGRNKDAKPTTIHTPKPIGVRAD